MARASDQSASGYSGKPLIAKLGWKPDAVSLAIAPPAHYATLTDAAPIRTARSAPAKGDYDFLHLFVRKRDELDLLLPKLLPRLASGGMLWVSWPKKSSAMFLDLTEDGVRACALPLGLVDVKVCAVDADWSGLKLMRRRGR